MEKEAHPLLTVKCCCFVATKSYTLRFRCDVNGGRPVGGSSRGRGLVVAGRKQFHRKYQSFLLFHYFLVLLSRSERTEQEEDEKPIIWQQERFILRHRVPSQVSLEMPAPGPSSD